MFGRYKLARYIETLDPQKDNQEIVYLVGSYEYPWLMQKSLEFALFRTYAVPHTSELLDQTGQFARHGQRRYDDTTLILAEIAEHGYDSERGRAAIRQMNRMHGRFSIANEDFLYVLSTFVFEPVRWHEKYGWRKPTRTEKLANFYFWREVGRRMNIKNIPEDYETFERFNIEHEQRHFRYADANRRVGDATIAIFLNWYPSVLRPFIRQILYGMMDDPLLEAFGYPRPHPFFRWLPHLALKTAAVVLRFLPPRRRPFSYTQKRNRSHPRGYAIEQLGPPEWLDDKSARVEESDKTPIS